MRYRLRTLLILMAAIAVILARVAYLKQRANSHRREASLCIDRLASAGSPRTEIARTIAYDITQPDLWQKAIHRPLDGAPYDNFELAYYHEIMAQRYERAAYRPWMLVSHIQKPAKKETGPPPPPYRFPSEPEIEQIKQTAAELGAPQPALLPPGYGETPNKE